MLVPFTLLFVCGIGFFSHPVLYVTLQVVIGTLVLLFALSIMFHFHYHKTHNTQLSTIKLMLLNAVLNVTVSRLTSL